MKTPRIISLFCAALVLPLGGLQAQFAGFSNDSSVSFLVESTGINSTNAGGTGVTIGGEIQFDHTELWLRVVIDNNTLGPNGEFGALSQFGFDTPFGPFDSTVLNTTTVSFSTDRSGFGLVIPYSEVPPGPGGQNPDNSDFHKHVGAMQTTAGDSDRIQFGQTGTFDFSFGSVIADTGFDASLFNANDFFAGTPIPMSFRFQGPFHEGAGEDDSDKFFGVFRDGDIITPPIPEPSTYGIAGVGLLLALVLVRRFRKTKQ